jgi:CheY-like chemotaxis protein
MKLHGGRIGVESEGEGTGSTFYIDIPVLRAQFTNNTPSLRSKAALRDMLRNILRSNGEDGSNRHIEHSPSGLHESHLLPYPGHGRDSRNSSRRIYTDDFEHTISSRVRNKPSSIPQHTNDSGYPKIDHSDSEILSSPKIHPALTVSDQEDHTPAESKDDQYISATSLKHVLIVDDSVVNRKMLKKYCASFFEQCDEAVNGLDAMRKIERYYSLYQESTKKDLISEANTTDSLPPLHAFGYDAIILDYMMPEMNGLQVMEELQRMKYRGKVIGLTGNTDDSMKEAFLSAGADLVLIKPLHGDDLQRIVDSLSQK